MAKISGVEAVGFDLDDTLFMTKHVAFRLENDTLAAIGREPMPKKVHDETWGMPLEEAIKLRSPGIDVEEFEEAFAEMSNAYSLAGRLDVLTPENEQVLKTLSARGLYLYVVTSRKLSMLGHVLNGDHPALPYFGLDNLYHAENCEHTKPDARVFDPLFAKGLEPHACVYVGDTPTDALASNAANINFVASLEAGHFSIRDFSKVRVAAFISNLGELVDLID